MESKREKAVKGERIVNHKQTLEEETHRRDLTIYRFKQFLATGLLRVADKEFHDLGTTEDWSVTRSCEMARKVGSLLSNINSDDPAWERSQKLIHGNIEKLKHGLLPLGHNPTVIQQDDLLLVSILFRGQYCSIADLCDEFRAEVTSRQEILDAREREVLENHLLGEIANQLHELIRDAEKWVYEINAELSERPTSTGMRLRFDWRPSDDAPPHFSVVRKRLLRTGTTWSPDDRKLIAEFLQERIKTARAGNEIGTWQEHLSVAMDYRSWHQFSVECQQEGHWKRLTRQTYGTGSGGEKAVILTLPQFAAAAAHYRSADRFAPRFILWDDAFVGVDNDMRGKCIGLLHHFDLDLIMTSEREWGCYPTLPGLAIYQLATRPGIDAISTTRWVWDGQQRIKIPYWVNTSDNALIKRLITNGTSDVKMEMEVLLKGGIIEKTIEDGVVFADLERSPNALWSLLLFSGYLTLAATPSYGTPCRLRIPNIEVGELYKSMIFQWFENSIHESQYHMLLNSLVKGDIETFSKIFQAFLISSVSIFDVSSDEPERIYHAFVLGMLIGLRERYEVKSNRESGYGRYDVMLIPKKSDDLGIVMEFKKVDRDEKTDLETAVVSALKQIEDKNYRQELLDRGVKRIIYLGLAFKGKQVLIRSK